MYQQPMTTGPIMQSPGQNTYQNMNTSQCLVPGAIPIPLPIQTESVSVIQYNLLLQSFNAATDQINMLQSQIEELIKRLPKTPKSTPVKGKYKSPTKEEEEEMVNAETIKNTEPTTKWIVIKNKNKKRKRNESVSPTKKVTNMQQKQPKKMMTIKPPPIIVRIDNNGINNVLYFLNQIGIDYKTTRLNDHQLKINVTDDHDYRSIINMLTTKSIQYHSYENKQNRPIRVMARNLHQTLPTEEIIKSLRDQGFAIIEASQKLKIVKTNLGVEKRPLPLFMLTFASNEDVKKIHEIKYICNMKVSIENLRKNKLIPQCKKCQQFGHTQNFCRNFYKCVKCGNDHETAHCKKEKSAPPRCCNCGEAHPANYRGCIVAKKLQELRDKKNNNNNTNGNNTNNKTTKSTAAPERNAPTKSPLPQRDNNISYAQVTKNTTTKQPPNKENISEILTLLLSKMNKMEQKISEMEKNQQKTSKGTNNSNKNGRN